MAAEIVEGGGEATIWEARLSDAGQDAALVRAFLAQVDAEYEAILEELNGDVADVGSLARRYQHVLAQDYFYSECGQQVRQALMRAEGEQHR